MPTRDTLAPLPQLIRKNESPTPSYMSSATRSSTAKSLASGFEWITHQEQVLMDRFMPFLVEQQQQGNVWQGTCSLSSTPLPSRAEPTLMHQTDRPPSPI